MQTRVTTHNVRSDIVGAARTAEYVKDVDGSDILCTQEDHGVNAASLMPDGWGTYQGGTRRCSVHWRESVFTKLTVRTLLLNLANGLTFPGAKREAAVVVLKDKRNGQVVKPTSAHFVPHADDDHKAGVITPMPRGAKAVRPAIKALLADAEDHPEHVQVVCGDFNIDERADIEIVDDGMVEQMQSAGFVTTSTADTHGADEYDQTYVLGARIVSQQVRAKGRSDHKAKTTVVEY